MPIIDINNRVTQLNPFNFHTDEKIKINKEKNIDPRYLNNTYSMHEK